MTPLLLALVLTSTVPVDPIALEYRSLWIKAEEREGKVKAELDRCEDGLRLALTGTTANEPDNDFSFVPLRRPDDEVVPEGFWTGAAVGGGVVAVVLATLGLVFLSD